MISEEQQDQAALYALGLLDEDERAEVERSLEIVDELRALVDELRETAASLALAAGAVTTAPPAALKSRLLATVERDAAGSGRGRAGGPRRAVPAWIPWALAAAAVAVAIVSGLERHRVVGRLAEANRQRHDLLAQLVVCNLQPTPHGTGQGNVAVLWDPTRRWGELIAAELPPPGSGHDYQLWAVEEGRKEAVNAGLVHVDDQGHVRVGFKPADTSGGPVKAFALSLEQAGGAETNRGPILLLGKL